MLKIQQYNLSCKWKKRHVSLHVITHIHILFLKLRLYYKIANKIQCMFLFRIHSHTYTLDSTRHNSLIIQKLSAADENHVYSHALETVYRVAYILHTQIHHKVQFVLILISKWLKKKKKITTATKKTRIFTVNCDTGINISHWWFWCGNRAVFIVDTNAICGFPLCRAHPISASYIGAEYVSKMKIICSDFIAWLVWLSTKLCCNFHFHTFCFENVPSCGDYYVGFIYCWLFSHCNFMQVYPPPPHRSLSFCLNHMRKPQTRLLLFISVNGFWACLIFAQLNLVVMFTAV